MRKIVIKVSVILFIIPSFCGCDTVNGLKNMLNCTFERKNIDNFRFAGVSLDNINSASDINLIDIAKITTAIVAKTAPVSFNVNLEGKNPNSSTAAIEQLKWILLLDDREVLNGNIVDKFSIPAKGSNTLPIDINLDAVQFLDGSTPESAFRLYQNITGKNTEQESTVTIKIKPTINGIEFPQYLTLKQTTNQK